MLLKYVVSPIRSAGSPEFLNASGPQGETSTLVPVAHSLFPSPQLQCPFPGAKVVVSPTGASWTPPSTTGSAQQTDIFIITMGDRTHLYCQAPGWVLSTCMSDPPLWLYYHLPLQMAKLRLELLSIISKDREGRREVTRAYTCPPILLPLWEGVWGHRDMTPWICSQSTLKWGGSRHMGPRCICRGADRC